MNTCWEKIGIWGDKSCVELTNYSHCQNCPVYSITGRNLLEQKSPLDYRQEWTELLTQEKVTLKHTLQGQISVVIFRMGREWFALKSQFFQEITQISPIRAIPNRSNKILLGLVNIRGELNLCISLKELLGLEMSEKEDNFQQNEMIYQRMVVLEKEGNNWVFSVDQIYGVYRFHPDELEKIPDSLSKSGNNYTKGMIKWKDNNVNYLDDELLFYTLDHKVL